MAFLAQLALVSESKDAPIADVTTVAAALQKQISRDLAPEWDIDGTIAAFVKLEDVPPGFWPLIVRDDISVDAAGAHCDDHGAPFALISTEDKWSVTASHEMLEMLCDPSGSRTISSQSVKKGQGRVDYLVEVSDPIGHSTYTINGVEVSDFYTPHYFDPVRAGGVRYSFTGAITEPRQVLAGGYLTWHDPAGNQWWQLSRFSGDPRFDSLGTILKSACGMRMTIDRHAEKRRREATARKRARRTKAQPLVHPHVTVAGRARAARLRERIEKLLAKA